MQGHTSASPRVSSHSHCFLPSTGEMGTMQKPTNQRESIACANAKQKKQKPNSLGLGVGHGITPLVTRIQLFVDPYWFLHDPTLPSFPDLESEWSNYDIRRFPPVNSARTLPFKLGQIPRCRLTENFQVVVDTLSPRYAIRYPLSTEDPELLARVSNHEVWSAGSHPLGCCVGG